MQQTAHQLTAASLHPVQTALPQLISAFVPEGGRAPRPSPAELRLPPFPHRCWASLSAAGSVFPSVAAAAAAAAPPSSSLPGFQGAGRGRRRRRRRWAPGPEGRTEAETAARPGPAPKAPARPPWPAFPILAFLLPPSRLSSHPFPRFPQKRNGRPQSRSRPSSAPAARAFVSSQTRLGLLQSRQAPSRAGLARLRDAPRYAKPLSRSQEGFFSPRLSLSLASLVPCGALSRPDEAFRADFSVLFKCLSQT
ncbi:atherin-like [Sphaerodactylus townsendi]|uniref:atherin-like n=1 Tax=Sphaerodactylus townsendi TaxID=933632 RepID=UPI0020272938|nr:atherin-like [Sphaerodactylus townsendi]